MFVLVKETSCGQNFPMMLSEKFVDLQWSAYSWRQCCIEGEKICSLVQIPFILCCDHARQHPRKQKPTLKLTGGILQI